MPVLTKEQRDELRPDPVVAACLVEIMRQQRRRVRQRRARWAAFWTVVVMIVIATVTLARGF